MFWESLCLSLSTIVGLSPSQNGCGETKNLVGWQNTFHLRLKYSIYCMCETRSAPNNRKPLVSASFSYFLTSAVPKRSEKDAKCCQNTRDSGPCQSSSYLASRGHKSLWAKKDRFPAALSRPFYFHPPFFAGAFASFPSTQSASSSEIQPEIPRLDNKSDDTTHFRRPNRVNVT